MSSSVMKSVAVIALVALGGALAAAGFWVAQTDDAPGAALFGVLFMIAAVTAAVKLARKT